MSSPLVEMVPNKVLVLTSRIDIAKREVVETDLLGGIIVTISSQPMIGMTEIFGGDKSYRGDKDLSKRDRGHRPRGDTAKSVSKGG